MRKLELLTSCLPTIKGPGSNFPFSALLFFFNGATATRTVQSAFLLSVEREMSREIIIHRNSPRVPNSTAICYPIHLSLSNYQALHRHLSGHAYIFYVVARVYFISSVATTKPTSSSRLSARATFSESGVSKRAQVHAHVQRTPREINLATLRCIKGSFVIIDYYTAYS